MTSRSTKDSWLMRLLTLVLSCSALISATAAEAIPASAIRLFVQETGPGRKKLHEQQITLTAAWTSFETRFVAPAPQVTNSLELGLHIGADAQELDLQDVRITNSRSGEQVAIAKLTLTNNDGKVAPAEMSTTTDTDGTPSWRLRVPAAPATPWSTLVRTPLPIALNPGTEYRIAFRAKGVRLPGSARLPGRVIIGEQANFFCDTDTAISGVAATDQLLYQSFWYGTIACQITGLAPGPYRLVIGNARAWFGDQTVRTFPVELGATTLGKISLDTTAGPPTAQDESFAVTLNDNDRLTLPGGRLSFLRVFRPDGALVAEATALAAMPRGYLAKQRYFFDPAQVTATKPGPPWPGTYKIDPSETSRLTAADVVGPDGVVYPDFHTAGVPGGIPRGQRVLSARDFGALPDDDLDDAHALERAAAAAQGLGGAAIVLEAGAYFLDQPVRITGNGVVIRGAGMERTRVTFRYAPQPGRVRFMDVADGATMHPSDAVELEVAHTELAAVTVTRVADSQVIRSGPVSQGDGGRFQLVFRGYELNNKAAPGPVRLRAQATWTDGTTAQTEISLDISAKHKPRNRPPASGAFVFRGVTPPKGTVTLTEDVQRGATTMRLSDRLAAKATDVVLIRTPPNPAFLARLRTTCPYLPREAMLEVAEVQDRQLTFSQPVRTSWSAAEGTTVVVVEAIRGCGIEDLTLEQTHPLWSSLIDMQYAVGCWVTRTRLVRAGQHPVRMDQTKWCTISDTIMENAWFKGGGGTAYAGFFSFNWDCLMENVTTRALRHAPCIQWASAGNVIRDSTFTGSDLQWHAGLALENLVENCVIDARGKQSYGWAMYASVPEAAIHGPSGPRNVVYGNEIIAKNGGLMMGGMNEGWLIIGNRIRAARSMALVAKDGSFDHLIRSNVFWLDDVFGEKATGPTILLATADCTGIDLIDNAFLGVVPPLSGGAARLGREQGNRLLSSPDEARRPTLEMPSVFAWQRARQALGNK